MSSLFTSDVPQQDPAVKQQQDAERQRAEAARTRATQDQLSLETRLRARGNGLRPLLGPVGGGSLLGAG